MKGGAKELETVSSISGTNYESFVTIWQVITNNHQRLVGGVGGGGWEAVGVRRGRVESTPA